AEAIAQLEHVHVVQIYNVGEDGGRPFLALEYVGGGSLAQKLGGRPLPPVPAARLVALLARGTEAAHAHGIVHRDLKPHNVLLAVPEDTGPAAADAWPRIDGTAVIPKITDFGLAKKLDAGRGHTQTGAVLGTPGYMAPEQAAGRKDITPRTDVYALGAILYECLTGRPPFRAPKPLDTVLLTLKEEPVPPRRLARKVPRDLETICLTCLQKDPARRYATAQALAEDLERVLAGEPIRARRAAAWERAWKWLRRRPAVPAAALGLLAVLGGAAGYHHRDLYLLATDQGQLAVESAAGVRLALRRDGEVVADLLTGHDESFTLPAGEYEVTLPDDPIGLEPRPPRFTLARNGREVIR